MNNREGVSRGDGNATREPAAPRPMDSASARQLVATFSASPDVVLVLSRTGHVLAMSRTMGAVEPDRAVGMDAVDLVLPSHSSAFRSAIQAVFSSRAVKRLDVATAVPEGAPAWHQVSVSPIVIDQDVAAAIVIAADITDRKHTEDRLRRAEALMVDTQGTAHLGTWEWDVSQPIAEWSEELYRIYGVTPATYTPTYEHYLQLVHPDDRAHVMSATERAFREHQPYSHDERIIRPDGSLCYLHTWANAIVDEHGKLTRLIGVCQDITDRKLAEVALEQRAAELSRANERLRHEMTERAEVEKQLRQVQKLEALGRLAGGIAHDFNNLMGVVIGYSSMMYNRLGADDPLRRHLAEIMKAGESAARMTGQLLAFSRDHVIDRVPLDLNAIVGDLADMLGRLIGEHIELKIEVEAVPRHVHANRSQLEQTLINLVVNARDAMPDGGTLSIATEPVRVEDHDRPSADLAAGEYVRLTVSDTGTGIDEETQSRIFDPFFTTKEEGKGTGLGLSTAFGIVKQYGGAITVTTSPGNGASFSIYLPLLDSNDATTSLDTSNAHVRTGTETILLVEDQMALRAVVREALESYGYTVIGCSDPNDALRRSAEHDGPIDLLLTDVVMPKMSGRELAERLLASRPGLRVLYISGYTNDLVLREGVEVRGAELLQKPFTPKELSARIGSVLDARPRR